MAPARGVRPDVPGRGGPRAAGRWSLVSAGRGGRVRASGCAWAGAPAPRPPHGTDRRSRAKAPPAGPGVRARPRPGGHLRSGAGLRRAVRRVAAARPGAVPRRASGRGAHRGLPLIAGAWVSSSGGPAASCRRRPRLLGQVRYPREFAARLWLLLGRRHGHLHARRGRSGGRVTGGARLRPARCGGAAVAMAAANVALAGAYFLTFILAGHGRYGWLCAATAAAIIAASIGGRLVGGCWPQPAGRHDCSTWAARCCCRRCWCGAGAGLVSQAWRYR